MRDDTPADLSPMAHAYEPPVLKIEWTSDRALAGADFMGALREQGPWNDACWQEILWHGGVHIARQRIMDDTVLPTQPAGTRGVVYWFSRQPKSIALNAHDILFDDNGLIAVNKPAWIPVQSTRASMRFSLDALVRIWINCPDAQALHRLDRGTSGVTLYARDSRTASHIGKQFFARTIKKEYLAWVSPTPQSTSWTMEGYVHRAAHPQHAFFKYTTTSEPLGVHDTNHAGKQEPPKYCRADFTVLHASQERALVRAMPHTGRTHQLRVQLAAWGCPIIGDTLYGAPWQLDDPRCADRMMLHAENITFNTTENNRITITAPHHNDPHWLTILLQPNNR